MAKNCYTFPESAAVGVALRKLGSAKEVMISPALWGKSLPKDPYLFRTTENYIVLDSLIRAKLDTLAEGRRSQIRPKFM
jgi:hypothetical protein